LIQGAEHGWPAWTIAPIAGGALLVVLGWRRAVRRSRASEPAIIEPGLFRLRTFRWGVAAALAFSSGAMGFLLILAESAPTTLRDGLAAAGAEVTVAAAYGNRIPGSSLQAITSLFSGRTQYPDAVTFTSASTAGNLVSLLDAAGLTLPDTVVRASIGPVTSRALRDLGIPPHIEAAESTLAGLVAALAVHFEVPKD